MIPQRNLGRHAPQPFHAALPQVQQCLIEQNPSQSRVEIIEDRTAALTECIQRIGGGRVAMGYVEIVPHCGGAMPEVAARSRHTPFIAIIRHLEDECLATPRDYPEAAFAMRWARTLATPSAAPGWQRYIAAVQQAAQLGRVLLLETTQDAFPAWRELWDTARAPDWKAPLRW